MLPFSGNVEKASLCCTPRWHEFAIIRPSSPPRSVRWRTLMTLRRKVRVSLARATVPAIPDRANALAHIRVHSSRLLGALAYGQSAPLRRYPSHSAPRSGRENLDSDMSRVASTSRLGSEFDAFLFAPIGEDSNGMSLSVLSALARMDLDPWREAAALAALPAATAARRVAALFRTLPDDTLSDCDRDTLAARVIALLPRPASTTTKSRLALANVGAIHFRYALFFAAYIFVLLASQFVRARHDSPTPSETSSAARPLTSSTQTSPTSSDH